MGKIDLVGTLIGQPFNLSDQETCILVSNLEGIGDFVVTSLEINSNIQVWVYFLNPGWGSFY